MSSVSQCSICWNDLLLGVIGTICDFFFSYEFVQKFAAEVYAVKLMDNDYKILMGTLCCETCSSLISTHFA